MHEVCAGGMSMEECSQAYIFCSIKLVTPPKLLVQ